VPARHPLLPRPAPRLRTALGPACAHSRSARLRHRAPPARPAAARRNPTRRTTTRPSPPPLRRAFAPTVMPRITPSPPLRKIRTPASQKPPTPQVKRCPGCVLIPPARGAPSAPPRAPSGTPQPHFIAHTSRVRFRNGQHSPQLSHGGGHQCLTLRRELRPHERAVSRLYH
jgi:hypothetical protein